MSCEEVRLYLEDGEAAWISRPGLEEHIARCPECAGFRERQKQLRAIFDLVRDETPPIPRSLDQKVLASYREHIRGLAEVRRSRRPARRFVLWALAWAPAAAFALAISYAEITWFTRGHEVPPTSAPRRAGGQVGSTGETGARPRAAATRARPQTTQTKPFAASSRDEGSRPIQAAGDTGSGVLPVDFRGLMYCDELSCGGAMDVIRMRVPAEALGLPLRASAGNQLVDADVLVGPDGVARGIRVVE